MVKELAKAVVVLSGYFAIAPLLGWYLARNRVAERATLCLLVSMPSWFPSKLTLMLQSAEFYRGHTKGFEFSLMVALGIALTVCAAARQAPGIQRCPRGVWLYLAYCALSCLSILSADNWTYGLMAAWKFTSVILVFIGAFHAFRDSEDLRWVLRTMAATLIFQAVVCLKMRFVDGLWQTQGWFEHQNPMCMWAYLYAIPVLSVAFAPETDRRDTLLFLGAAGAAGLMILLSVSRAGLAAYVAGAVAVTGMAFLRGSSAKKLGIATAGGIGALVAGLLALDSLMARVNEDRSRENEEDLRPVLNRQARAMLEESPVGIGWNNFGVVNSLPTEKYVSIMMDWDQSRGFRIYDENYYACPLTESLYWLILSETGYPGFVGYVAFLGVTLWWGVCGLGRSWRMPLGYFVGGILVALMLTYVHGSVERVLSQTKNLSAWLIVSGFIARVAQMPRPRCIARAVSLVPTRVSGPLIA